MTVVCLGCGKPSVSWRCWPCTKELAASLGDHRAAFHQTMADARKEYPDFDFDGAKEKAERDYLYAEWKAKYKAAGKKKAKA